MWLSGDGQSEYRVEFYPSATARDDGSLPPEMRDVTALNVAHAVEPVFRDRPDAVIHKVFRQVLSHHDEDFAEVVKPQTRERHAQIGRASAVGPGFDPAVDGPEVAAQALVYSRALLSVLAEVHGSMSGDALYARWGLRLVRLIQVELATQRAPVFDSPDGGSGG